MDKKTTHSEHIFLFPFTWQIFKGKHRDKSFAKRTDIEYIKKMFYKIRYIRHVLRILYLNYI